MAHMEPVGLEEVMIKNCSNHAANARTFFSLGQNRHRIIWERSGI
jgi:hypothetical protein